MIDRSAFDQHTLFSSFELSGYWWLPESPHHRVVGTLRYSPEDTSLSVHGFLTPEVPKFFGTLSGRFERFSCVFGQVENGERCTLFNLITLESILLSPM